MLLDGHERLLLILPELKKLQTVLTGCRCIPDSTSVRDARLTEQRFKIQILQERACIKVL